MPPAPAGVGGFRLVRGGRYTFFMLPETLAREIIASHQQRPRNRGELPGAAWHALDNPGCGDTLTVWLRDGPGGLELRFSGQGCAISQASASLMTVALKGHTPQQARRLSERFRAMVMGGTPPQPDDPKPGDLQLGDLQALSGVSRLHARRRCALLAWRALEALLDGQQNGPAATEAGRSSGMSPG